MLVIRDGRVIDPSRGFDEIADVVIEAGRVSRIGRGAGAKLQGERVRVIDAKGHWVVPGFIDLHVHFREPGYEYKEDIASGLRAAAAGGFTSVCAMPNTKPINDTRAITEMMMARGREAGGPRLYPFGAATLGSRGEQLTEMADLRDAGAIGVSDDGKCLMNSGVMRSALEYARTFDLLFSQHCEDHNLTRGAQMHEGHVSTRLGLGGWPRAAEDIIVARDLILAELTGARYHVAHVSTLGSVRLLREAKSRGLKVSAEVTPHHLMLNHEKLLGFDTACKVNPPLREPEDIAALREALKDGTIDCIATDHAPHSSLEKDCEFAAASPGMIGLEPAVPVLLDLVREGLLTPLRLCETLSTQPARVAKLPGGSLREGDAADIALIDPERAWTINAATLCSRSSNTPFLDRAVRGRAVLTIVAGQIVYEA
ncbi:MAG TPA: dihydroorotase [Polyangiales bacterium]|nr:dihydroorotase [Polyangiales bacterium]